MELEKAHNWTDFDKLTTVPYNKDRQFVGIEYPGIVKNVDKALATLGGIENIEQACVDQISSPSSSVMNTNYSMKY